ncbi:MAG: response regulator [Dehalococcoidia bacterium]
MAMILAVDDSMSMLEMVTFTLKAAGHQVMSAADGVDALAKAEKSNVDLVLTDVNMPNMDGISLVQALRASERHRFTPILILTTESTQEKKLQGKSAGATGWIVKPFEPDSLLKTIDKVLS